MATSTQSTLLRRSDTNCYQIHVGADWEEVATLLSLRQAFVVEPICYVPCTAIRQPTVAEGSCVLLRNNWFYAESDEDAVMLLLRARICEANAKPDSDCTPSICQDDPMDDERVSTTEATNTKEADQRLWDCVVACENKDANKASDVRSCLLARFGKQEAKLILASCTTIVTKSSDGHSNRVLKAPTGELLKLK